MRKGWMVAVLVGMLCPAVRGQEVRVHVPEDTVAIGARFSVAVVARYPADARVHWPWEVRADTVLGDFEVLRVREVFQRAGAGIRVDSVVLEGTTFALDSMRVGPVMAQLERDGSTQEVSAPVVVVPVRSLVPPDAADIRDLAPLIPFPYPSWLYAVSALLAVAVLVALVMLIRRRRQESEAEETPLPEAAAPPYTLAVEALQALERQLPLSPETVKPFYVTLTDIFREYLSDTVQVDATTLTSGELVHALRHMTGYRLPEHLLLRIDVFLRESDLVKFAGFIPPVTRHAEVLREVRVLIQEIEKQLSDTPDAHPFPPAAR